MMLKIRRRNPRSNVSWPGMYLAEGCEGATWQSCFMFDMSVHGVGLELFGIVPIDLMGQRIAIQVQTPGGPAVSMPMVGQVRSIGPGQSHGGVRVGLEFVSPLPTEHSLQEILDRMQMAS
jgi:hypothetical protein